MNTKKLLSSIILMAVLVVTFASSSPAFAVAACDTGVIVVSGDTLRKIADRCGTTIAALRLANPEIGSGNLIYPGQSLILPGAILGTDGGFFIYVVARGDALKSLAVRFGTTVDALLAANKNITNVNLIYEGQRLTVYVGPNVPPTAPPPAPGRWSSVPDARRARG